MIGRICEWLRRRRERHERLECEWMRARDALRECLENLPEGVEGGRTDELKPYHFVSRGLRLNRQRRRQGEKLRKRMGWSREQLRAWDALVDRVSDIRYRSAPIDSGLLRSTSRQSISPPDPPAS